MRGWILALALSIAAPLPLIAVEAATYNVYAYNYYWSPSSITVNQGDSVTFRNGAGSHTWVSDSGMGSCGLPCTKTFNSAGTFYYHCGVHPSMTGQVVVNAPVPPPAVSISAPTAGEVLHGVVSVSGSASHESQSISKVEIRVDSGTWSLATLTGSGTSVTWSASLDTTKFADGTHTIGARATTSGGVTGETSVSVEFRNGPTVSILSPTAGEAVQGTMTASGSATSPASPVASVEWRVDGGAWSAATVSGTGTDVTWSAAVDTLPLAIGLHTLEVRGATDSGHVGAASVQFDVQNPPYYDLSVPRVAGTTGTFYSQIEVRLRNDGNAAVGPFKVLVEYEYKGTWRPIGEIKETGLAAKTEVTRVAFWTNPLFGTTFVGKFPVRATADHDGAVAESVETNNVGTGTAAFHTVLVNGVDTRSP